MKAGWNAHGWGVPVLRWLVAALVGCVSFALGCLATLNALLRIFAPSGDCPSPCDAPAYVALGVTLFVGPVVGVLFAGVGIYALSRLWRRRPGTAA